MRVESTHAHRPIPNFHFVTRICDRRSSMPLRKYVTLPVRYGLKVLYSIMTLSPVFVVLGKLLTEAHNDSLESRQLWSRSQIASRPLIGLQFSI